MEEQKLYQYLPMSLQLWILGRPQQNTGSSGKGPQGVWGLDGYEVNELRSPRVCHFCLPNLSSASTLKSLRLFKTCLCKAGLAGVYFLVPDLRSKEDFRLE